LSNYFHSYSLWRALRLCQFSRRSVHSSPRSEGGAIMAPPPMDSSPPYIPMGLGLMQYRNNCWNIWIRKKKKCNCKGKIGGTFNEMGICYLRKQIGNNDRCEGALLAFTSIDLSKNAFFENICFSSPAETSFINYWTPRLGRERGTMG